MLRQGPSYEPLLRQIAQRADATPNFLLQGVAASAATHVAVISGYSLYLLCAAWLANADLPEWMPPRSGVRSQPQVASTAIVIEAAFADPEDHDQHRLTMEVPAPTPTEPAPPPEAQDTDVDRTADSQPLPARRREAELPEVIANQRARDVAPAGRSEARDASDESPPAPRAATVPKRGHGVAVQTVTSVPSVASRESTGAETEALPQQVYSPAPEYPRPQYNAGIGGRVRIRVALDAGGRVTSATIYRTSGEPALDRAALEAVRQWRFEPASPQRPTVRELVVPIRFIPPDHQMKSSPP